ncbi:MAG: FAD-dependent monooxygenase [Patescibacteria group bacterium]
MFRQLQIVNDKGETKAGVDMSTIAKSINNRFLSIARSDLAATIYHACSDVDTRFDTSIVGITQDDSGVIAKLSDGSKERFDLVIGADGLHSEIRKIVFGPEEKFEKHLGYRVAAFELPNYKPRNELTYIMHAPVKKSVSRFSMRNGNTLFIFVFRSELAEKEPETETEEKEALLQVFGDMSWETPKILERMNEVEDIYFDSVSQIHLDCWTKGRVALIGDAASCASLLAGEGTGLAMTQAYVLAGELKAANGDHQKAFENYEKRLRDFIKEKQKGAEIFGGFFAPKTTFGQKARNIIMQSLSFSPLRQVVIDRSLRDNIDLPDYDITKK